MPIWTTTGALVRLLRNELINDEPKERKSAQLPLLGLVIGRGKKEEQS